MCVLCRQVVNICVWVLASAFGVPAMVMGNVEEEQEHNSKSFKHRHKSELLSLWGPLVDDAVANSDRETKS